MTILLFARHGETADNAKRIFQGQSGRGLNTRGRAQAGRLAERMNSAKLDAIVASDLERAVETANIVGSLCGLPVELDRELREVDVGSWTGRGYDEIAALFPAEWDAWSAGFDVRRGGGETYGELSDRIERAASRIAHRHPNGRVLVVSHGGAIKSYVARLLGVSNDGLRVLAGHGNAGLTVIERDAQGKSRLHGWNDTAHLEGLVVDEQTD